LERSSTGTNPLGDGFPEVGEVDAADGADAGVGVGFSSVDAWAAGTPALRVSRSFEHAPISARPRPRDGMTSVRFTADSYCDP
jgi:hypothetical protein